MPVVGVLVEAQIGDDHEGVTEVVLQIGQGDLHDPVGVPGL